MPTRVERGSDSPAPMRGALDSQRYAVTIATAPPEAVVMMVPVNLIDEEINNRETFDEDALRELAEDIQQKGLLQPIGVRRKADGRYQAVWGHRRLRATRDVLGLPDILARDVTGISDEEAVAAMLSENNHRAEVNPVEEGRGYARAMRQFGWSESVCAQRAKVSIDRVQKRLGLLRLLDEYQLLVTSGQLPVRLAELMINLDPERQKAAMRVVQGASRLPTTSEFRRVCGELENDQGQMDLFDLADLWAEQITEAAASGQQARKHRLVVNPRIPRPDFACNRRDWLANQMVEYARQLREAGLVEGADAIIAVVDHCVQAGRLDADDTRFADPEDDEEAPDATV